MLSKEDNDMLTQTDRGTPMGEVFRRFWIPVLLSEEVPLPDCPPVRFRILGEDLLAFRDSEGRVGVMEPNCPHRGAPLYFGRNEDCGIRCLYHGWKYDVTGQCVDMPNIPNGDVMKKRMRITAYPTVEGVGMVWAYMGPEDRQPPLPDFGWWDLPAEHYYVTKYEQHCNWLQAFEGDFDTTHGQFVHFGKPDAPVTVKAQGERMRRTLKSFDTPIGYVFATAQWNEDGTMNVLDVRQNVYPSTAPPGLHLVNGLQAKNIRIPIDDAHEWQFRLRYTLNRELTQEELIEYKSQGYNYDGHMPGSWLSKGNKFNDYLQDRILQQQFNFSGITAFQRQDAAMIEDQWGAICDRTKEHLVASDICIIQTRNRLLAMCKAIVDGKNIEEPFLLAERKIVQQFKDPLEPVPASMAVPDDLGDEIARRLNTVRLSDYQLAFDTDSLRDGAAKTWDEDAADRTLELTENPS
jgi:phthalate 4,5-dioxygenase